jgi:hypothetical protein
MTTTPAGASTLMRFYLGAHHPHWLARTDVPLCVSRRALARLRTLARARGRWALDSGGFTELSTHGAWRVTARAYAEEARRFATEIGGLDFAAIQDWMCEPAVRARTGLTVEDHQRRTIASYLTLTELAPEVPWLPVVQGWCSGDYEDHVEAYAVAGIDLAHAPLVGVGSICRRQATLRTGIILGTLAGLGLRLHGFGVKTTGLRAYQHHLASADSMAWSVGARFRPPLDGHAHKTCANCLEWALGWRDELLERLAQKEHLPTFHNSTKERCEPWHERSQSTSLDSA